MTFGASVRSTRRKSPEPGSVTKPASVIESLRSSVLHTRIGIAEVVLGLIAAGGIFSALLGHGGIRIAAIIAVVVAVLGLFALLVVTKREWRRHADLDRRLLLRYCNLLHERSNTAWRVLDWRQVVTIEANGDAHDKIRFTALPDCDTLDFLTFWEGPNWEWPGRHQRRTGIRVRGMELDGDSDRRFDVTSVWLTRGRLKVMVHASEPVLRGTKINVQAEFTWPAKCLPFIQGRQEEFVKIFTPGLEHLEYTVVLPPGLSGDWYGVGLKALTERYSVRQHVNKNGREEIRLVADGVATGARVGMKLEIK